jgi:hypothetical protein
VTRATISALWSDIDARCVARFLAEHPPGRVWRDGARTIKVVTRAGPIHLQRQLCVDRSTGEHSLPGNAALPPHEGMIFTRGAQELACLLTTSFPCRTAARLFGWLARDEKAISATQARVLIRQHGEAMRAAEAELLQKVAEAPAGAPLPPIALRPVAPPRRPRAWPAELDGAVKAALEAEEQKAPRSIAPAVWDRVVAQSKLQNTEAESPVELTPTALDGLARLGPKLGPDQLLVSIDEIMVRAREKRSWIHLRRRI